MIETKSKINNFDSFNLSQTTTSKHSPYILPPPPSLLLKNLSGVVGAQEVQARFARARLCLARANRAWASCGGR